MKSTFSKDVSTSFLVDEAAIKKIFKLLSDRIGKIETTAYCVDDTRREFQSVNELLSYENSFKSRIARLRFYAISEDYGKRAEVDFNGFDSRGITLEVTASDLVTSRLKSNLLEVIDGCRPWYALFARTNFLVTTWLAVMAFVLYVASGGGLGPIVSIAKFSISELNISSNLVMSTLVVATFGVSVLLALFKSRLFPLGHFLIGQQIAKYDLLEKIRWGVLVSLLVSLVAGLILG